MLPEPVHNRTGNNQHNDESQQTSGFALGSEPVSHHAIISYSYYTMASNFYFL